MTQFTGPKGVPDYLPPSSRAFTAVRDALLRAADRAGYAPIELPIFEDTALFARGVGESTDVVSKEMYTFADRGGRSVTLRPEGTAGVIRAVIEHGLDRGPLPVKLAYAGPFFRYERPQAGRYRQLQQVGIEAIGSDDPALDAEVIAVADEGFRSIGLTGYRLEITSLGDGACRPGYHAVLQEFLAGLPLDGDTRRRAELNPLRVLDDKRPEMQALLADAPLMIDHLCDACRAHFDAVLGVLDVLSIPFARNPRMVRGLDYYTRTTFEFVHPGLGAQSGIGGGGRYDGLMAELGGQSLPGIGFGIGVDRTMLAAAAEGLTVAPTARCEVFGVPIGAASTGPGSTGADHTAADHTAAGPTNSGSCSSAATITLAQIAGQLRAAGVRVDLSYGRRALKGAMRAAVTSGARMVLIVGERELASGTVVLKDLESGDQRSVPLTGVSAAVLSALRTAGDRLSGPPDPASRAAAPPAT